MSRILASIREFLALERNILVLCTTAILLNIAMNLYSPFLSLYFIKLGTPMELLGLIFSVFAFARALVVLAGGHLSDRYGRKKIIVLSNAISTVSLLPLYWVGVGAWPIAIVCLIGMNFGWSFYRPVGSAIVADSLPKEKRATAFSTMATIAFWGGVIGPILGGYLTLEGNYSVAFLYASLILFVMTFLRQLLLRELKAKRNRSMDKDQTSEHHGFIGNLRLIWNSSRSTRAYLIFGILSSLSGLAGPWFALFYQDVIKLDNLQIGILSAASLVPNIIAQIPGGKLSDKIGRKPILLLGLITSPLLILAITQSTSFIQLLIIEIIFGCIGGLTTGASLAFPTELVPAEYRGTALGVFSATSQVAGALSPSLGTLVVTLYPFTIHPRYVFYTSILASIPCIVIFLFFVEETLKRAHA